MSDLSAAMTTEDDPWTRLERAVLIDDERCACTLAGSMTCGRHADTSLFAAPDRWTAAAEFDPSPPAHGAWRVAIAAAAAIAVVVGVGVALVWFTPPDGGSSVELPPMSLPTPARLALLGATVGCFAGGLSLGLTRRDRPVDETQVRR